MFTVVTLKFDVATVEIAHDRVIVMLEIDTLNAICDNLCMNINAVALLVGLSLFLIADDRVHLYVISRHPQQTVSKFLFDTNAQKLTYEDRIANESAFVR